MKTLTCIVCPNGCRITCEALDGGYRFSGNRCNRGAEYALSEMTRPMRTLCTTVRTVFPAVPALPVRTSAPIPKESVFDVMRALKDLRVDTRVRIGEVVVRNVCGLGSDVICTSSVFEE